MAWHAETLLMWLVVGLFLKDSLRMLQPDEAMLVRGVGGRWRAGFGARSWRLGGREPYIANPFLPHEPAFRLRWQMAAPAVGPGSAPIESPQALPHLGWIAWALWIELFVLLPVALSGRVAWLSSIVAIVLLYASAVLAMSVVGWQRRALGLSGRAVRGLAFDCIVCPPYAANLVRRVAALQPAQEDFVAAMRRLVEPARQPAIERECLARIDDRIEAEASGGIAMAALQAGRERFVTEARDERE